MLNCETKILLLQVGARYECYAQSKVSLNSLAIRMFSPETAAKYFISQRKTYRARRAGTRSGQIAGRDMTYPVPHQTSHALCVSFCQPLSALISATYRSRNPDDRARDVTASLAAYDEEEERAGRVGRRTTIAESILCRNWRGRVCDLQPWQPISRGVNSRNEIMHTSNMRTRTWSRPPYRPPTTRPRQVLAHRSRPLSCLNRKWNRSVDIDKWARRGGAAALNPRVSSEITSAHNAPPQSSTLAVPLWLQFTHVVKSPSSLRFDVRLHWRTEFNCSLYQWRH